MHSFTRELNYEPSKLNSYALLLLITTIIHSCCSAIFKLDDGTGVIECWRYLNNSREEVAFCLHLGDFVATTGVLYLQNRCEGEGL